jgi:hypothetical protein
MTASRIGADELEPGEAVEIAPYRRASTVRRGCQSLLELDGAAAGAGAGVLDELLDDSDDELLLDELLDEDVVVLLELPRLSVL